MTKIPSAGVPLGLTDLVRALAARGTDAFRDDLARFTGARHAGLTSTGSAAFYLTLKALAARSDRREVVLPAYTAPVVLLPVQRAGLRPVFADVALETFNMAPPDAARLVTANTLAVMPAHMFGIPCELHEIRSAAAASGAAVIEDAASALGATIGDRLAGTLGDAGFYSFHRGKQITSVTGGAWVTDDAALAADIARRAERLRVPGALERARMFARLAALSIAVRPWGYTALHPLLDRFKDTAPHETFELHAYTAVQAGVCRSLLARIDQILAARNARAERARALLEDVPGITLPLIPPGTRPAFNHCPLLLPGTAARTRALAAARDAGIECTTLYDRTVYHAYDLSPDEYRASAGARCPNAEDVAARLLLIPCHPLVPMARLEQAAEIIKAAV